MAKNDTQIFADLAASLGGREVDLSTTALAATGGSNRGFEVAIDGRPPVAFGVDKPGNAAIGALAPGAAGLTFYLGSPDNIDTSPLRPRGIAGLIYDLVNNSDDPDETLRAAGIAAADEPYVRAWLGPELLAELTQRRIYQLGYRVDVDDGLFRVIRPAGEDDPERLRFMVDLVSRLADRGRQLADDWFALGRSLSVDSGSDETWRPGGLPLEITRDGRTVRVTAQLEGAGKQRPLCTVVTGSRQASRDQSLFVGTRTIRKTFAKLSPSKLKKVAIGEALPYPYTLHAADRDRAVGLLSGDLAAKLTELSPLFVVCDSVSVKIGLEGFVAAADRIQLAADICARLQATE